MNTSHAPMLSRSRAIALPLVLLMSLGVSLVSPVSAAVPIAPPTGGVPGGLFSQNFSNMSAGGCTGNRVIVGFDPSVGASYMTPICLNISGIVGSIIATSNIDALIRVYLGIKAPTIPGQVLTGFDPVTGSGQYIAMSSSQWRDGFVGDISYPGYLGNVGIGTILGVPPTEKLQVVGNIAVSGDITASGNMIAATPTAPNHLATKAYVDAQVVSAGGGLTVYQNDGVTVVGKFLSIGTRTPRWSFEPADGVVYYTNGSGSVTTLDYTDQSNARFLAMPNVYFPNTTCAGIQMYDAPGGYTRTLYQIVTNITKNNTGKYYVGIEGGIAYASSGIQNWSHWDVGTNSCVTDSVTIPPYTGYANMNIVNLIENKCGRGSCVIR